MLYPIQNDRRNRLDLSGIWEWRADPEQIGENEGWASGLSDARPMAVPGSWNEQYEELFNYFDLGWYVRRCFVPSAWAGQRLFIRVGSAPYVGTLYVNGERVGSHEGGHLPFAFEVTAQLRAGEENVIAISVENRLSPERVPPGNSPGALTAFTAFPRTTYDFFPFTGIHRPVVLYSVPPRFIEDVTVVTEIDGGDGRVRLSARLHGGGSAVGKARLAGGAAPVEVALRFEGGVAAATLEVPAARLWSDRDPFLYELTVETEEDRYALPVGIRTVAVEGSRILLNGEPVRLNGFGRHEDFYASGKGLNLPLLVKDYQLMRWSGANAYRTSHYPYSEEEMQLADREGFLIIDEIPAVGLGFDDGEALVGARHRMALRQIEELIARDKNHPSVLMWSVANEPMPAGPAATDLDAPESDHPSVRIGKDFLDSLLDRARALDPTRPVTLATMAGVPPSWMEGCDVIAINRYWGWYVLGGELDKARAALEGELDAFHARFRRPILITEFGADTMAGMHGHPDLMWSEEYQAALVRLYLEVAADRDFIAGMQVWNFADFAAVQSITRVGGFNLKGVFTRARAPKMAAHVLREFWTKR